MTWVITFNPTSYPLRKIHVQGALLEGSAPLEQVNSMAGEPRACRFCHKKSSYKTMCLLLFHGWKRQFLKIMSYWGGDKQHSQTMAHQSEHVCSQGLCINWWTSCPVHNRNLKWRWLCQGRPPRQQQNGSWLAQIADEESDLSCCW